MHFTVVAKVSSLNLSRGISVNPAGYLAYSGAGEGKVAGHDSDRIPSSVPTGQVK